MTFLCHLKQRPCPPDPAPVRACDLQPTVEGQLGSPCGQAALYPHAHELYSPPPYELATPASVNNSPAPTTSWTAEIGTMMDKLRDDAASMMINTGKQLSPKALDRKGISQGIKLVTIAADEFDEGNEAIALDIYLSGLDKIVMAIPNKTKKRTKRALKEKLQSVEERVGIVSVTPSLQAPSQSTHEWQAPKSRYSSLHPGMLSQLGDLVHTALSPPTSDKIAMIEKPSSVAPIDLLVWFKRLGQWVIEVTVVLAVLVKQSPIPSLLHWLTGYLLTVLYWMNAQFDLVTKSQSFGFACIRLLLVLDERYRLHELVSEAIYIVVAATLKAILAYRDTAGYNQRHAPASLDAPLHLHMAQPPSTTPSPKPRWHLFF